MDDAPGAALPRFEMTPLSAEQGGGYIVEFPDYPGCIADGETPEQALAESRDALLSYTRTLADLGREPPSSGGLAREARPGRSSLQASLARRAASEGVPLRQFITALLAEGLDRREGAIGN